MRFAERAERHDILVCRESSCDISVSVFSPFSNCWTRPRLNATEVVKLTHEASGPAASPRTVTDPSR
jgi:hypothetical protein